MKVTYTLAGIYYQPSDIELALRTAEAVAQQSGKSVIILLENKTLYAVLAGVNGLKVTGSNYSFNTIQGHIVTRLQYQGANGEIILTVCPTLQLLQKFQDSGISLLIVVPEMTASADIFNWLDLNSALDIQSRTVLSGIGHPIAGVKRAIGYLKDYCLRMNVDLTHTPVYSGELADVANTLKKQGVAANSEEVMKYCLLRGMSFAEATIAAKAFCQKTMLKMRGTPDYNAYWNTINDPKWEQIP